MRGHVLVHPEDGRRCIYVPEAHIQFDVAKSGTGKWIVCAYRTDGYWGRTREEAIPTVEHLRQAYQWTAQLEVPEHLVTFAVESERRRQESVEGIEQILSKAVGANNPRVGFKEFMNQLGREKLDRKSDEDVEDTIGEEIHQLLTQAGGLQ